MSGDGGLGLHEHAFLALLVAVLVHSHQVDIADEQLGQQEKACGGRSHDNDGSSTQRESSGEIWHCILQGNQQPSGLTTDTIMSEFTQHIRAIPAAR